MIELATHLFRATQTGDNFRRDKIKYSPKQTLFKVGDEIHQTIKELSGEKPELAYRARPQRPKFHLI